MALVESDKPLLLRVHHDAIDTIIKNVCFLFGYRSDRPAKGFLRAQRRDEFQAGRQRLRYVFDLTLRWQIIEAPSYEADDLDPDDETNWPVHAVYVRVEDQTNNPDSRSKCSLEAAKIIQALQKETYIWVQQEKESPPEHRFGSARWAKRHELETASYLSQTVPKDQFLVGHYRIGEDDYKYLSIPVRETERHALVCGPTGSGKSTSIFIPNLIERTESCAIVTEAAPKGILPHLFRTTAAHRQRHGHRIYYFNPADSRSHRINPLDLVERVADAQDLADILIRNTTLNTHVGDQVWENAERQLLTALIMIAVHDRSTATMANIRKMLVGGQKKLREHIQKGPAGKARNEALALMSLSTEGFLNSIMVGLLVRLSPFLTPSVAALTSSTNIDLKSLPDELFTFYLAVPAGNRQIKPVAAMILNFLLDLVLQTLEKREFFPRPLTLLLDELTNFGYIPDLPTHLTIMRHARIPLVLGFQDTEQLMKVYGQQDGKIIFRQPATRIFFRPNDEETARGISSQLGQGTRKDHQRGNLYARKLMTPEEVLGLNQDRAVCLLPSTRPVKAWRLMPQMYEQQTKDPPPLCEPAQIDDRIVELLNYQTEEFTSAVESVKEENPRVLDEPKSPVEQDNLLNKQNKNRRFRSGEFSRNRVRSILDRVKPE